METKIKMAATLLFVAAALSQHTTAFAGGAFDHCLTGDVTSLSHAGIHGSFQLSLGKTNSILAKSILNCQARLFDDNGPDIPHVWCEQDRFLLGITVFNNYKLAGTPRITVVGFLEQVINQVFWSGSGGTAEAIVERSATKDAISPSVGHLVAFSDYAIFGEPALSPGDYSWNWVQKHPLATAPGNPNGILFTGSGEVQIVSHEEHLARIAAGTWR